ncbi:MAG: hypothetical protein MI741_16010, partial [Rhodospirillales bacterium]|nr:hypothetical protein [Rhodospirillales bacterium]
MFKKIQSLGLGARIIVVVVGVLFVVVLVNYVTFVRGYRRSAQEAMVEKAAAFTAVADETKNHVAKLNKAGSFDSETLLKELAADRALNKDYRESRIFETIPVVAGWTAAE